MIRRLATAALESGAAIVTAVGWVLMFVGLGFHYGWWLSIIGIGAGMALAGAGRIVVLAAHEYVTAEPSAPDTRDVHHESLERTRQRMARTRVR